MNKAQLIAQIRFQLAQLGAGNGHHLFEHLARHLARAKIQSNILPATGPVSAGGDQGRDFETYRSSIEPPLSPLLSDIDSGSRPVAFACTLDSRIERKIRADVAKLAKPKPAKVKDVVYMCEPDVPVGKRHKLIAWAEETHGVELQVFDGLAISEMLAEPDVFWIAQHYLGLAAEAYPEPSDKTGWYYGHRERWRDRQPVPYNAADFFEVKTGLRQATFGLEARPDLVTWLERMQVYVDAPLLPNLARAARYEIAVATLRGKGDMNPVAGLVEEYFADLEDWLGEADIENGCVLFNYVLGAYAFGAFDIDLAKLLTWQTRLGNLLDEQIDQAPGPGRRASMLGIRAILATLPVNDDPRFGIDRRFDDWEAMLDAAADAPMFPIEEFTDRLNKLAPHMSAYPRFQRLAERAEELVARRAGPATAADKSFERAVENFEDDELLIAVRNLHRTQYRWFTGDRLEDFQRATYLLARCYIELGLPYAAKYVALAGSYIAYNSSKPHVQGRLPGLMMLIADADDAAGNSLTYVAMLLAAIGSHGLFEPNAFAEEHHEALGLQFGQIASLRGLAARMGDGHLQLIDEVLEEWPALFRDQIVAASNDPAGFQFAGTADEVWAGIGEGFIGRPFGDCGPERSVEWRALGVRWIARFSNTLDATAIAEEFIARFQLVQAALASVDMLLPPTMVTMELDTGAGGDAADLKGEGLETTAGRDGLAVKVQLGNTESSQTEFEEGSRAFVEMAVLILGECSLLPSETFTKRLGPEIGEALNRVFIGRPYGELYREFVPPEAFRETKRSALPAFAPERSFASREHPLLVAPSSSGYGYKRKNALQAIRERYERGARSVQFTLPRLLSDKRIRTTLLRWHDEGLLDWEILCILSNAANNLRFPLADEYDLDGHLAKFQAIYDLGETPGQALYPEGFSDAHLTINRHSFHGAVAAGLRLRPCGDFEALETLLVSRYGLRTDDVDHDNVFGWNAPSVPPAG